jgi:hypothetical protein
MTSSAAILSTMEFIGDLERAFGAAIYPNRVPIAIGLVVALVAVAIVARRQGWHLAARRHPRASGVIAAVVLAVGLPLGWYLASPLFLSRTIDEPAPVIGAAPSSSPAPSSSAASPASSASPAGGSPSPSPVASSMAPRSGEFTGADEFHFGRGTATLLETEPGRYVVRLEDFEVRNGPDLFVYLSPSDDGYADGAVELSRLKADKGNQNYDLPAGIDLDAVRSVVMWCKQFSVQFAHAPLAAG